MTPGHGRAGRRVAPARGKSVLGLPGPRAVGAHVKAGLLDLGEDAGAAGWSRRRAARLRPGWVRRSRFTPAIAGGSQRPPSGASPDRDDAPLSSA